MVLFSSFCVAQFCQKTNLKILHRHIFEVLDDIKAIFEPIDLKFGMHIVYTCVTRILYSFQKNYSIFLYICFFENIKEKIQNCEILRQQLCTPKHFASSDILQSKIA